MEDGFQILWQVFTSSTWLGFLHFWGKSARLHKNCACIHILPVNAKELWGKAILWRSMANITSLFYTLVGSGVLFFLLSFIVACLGPFYKSQVLSDGDSICKFCSMLSFTVMMIGVVNMIICIIPVIIGVYAAEERCRCGLLDIVIHYCSPKPCFSWIWFWLGSFEYDRIQLSTWCKS